MKNASIPNYKLPREYWLHNKALKISDVKRKKSSDDVGSRPRKYDQKRTKNI